MSAVPHDDRELPARPSGSVARDRLAALGRLAVGRGAPVVVLVLFAASIVLRTRNLGAPFWIDEGISVGVAHFPFADIPSALRLDGNPPVYYLLLHVWLQVFGDGESAAHALSMTFAVLTVPVAWLLAKRPLGRTPALAAAAVAATIPYLTYFGQETRMYAMVAFLSLLVAGIHLRVFDRGARRWQVALVVVLAVMLYTHTWAVFLTGGSVLAVGARALLEPDRAGRWRVVRIGFVVHAAAGLLWLPWVPILAKQAAETGAPWSVRPSFDMAVQALASIGGDALQGTIFVLALVAGTWAVASASRGRLDGRGVAEPTEARALRGHAIVLATILVSTLLFAWIGSLVSPAWANRYVGVLVGPAILLAATVLSRSGRAFAVVAIALCVSWGLSTQGDRLTSKGSPRPMVDAVARELRPGDLVVSIQPEQLPVVAYDLERRGAPRGLRYATALGRQEDVRLFDWRRGLDRLQAAQSWRVERRLVAGQAPGSRILLVQPIVTSGNWTARWTKLIASRSRAWRAIMQADPRLSPVGRRPVNGPGRGVYGVLFTVRP